MKQITSLRDLRAFSAVLVVLSHIPITNTIFGGGIGRFAVIIFFILSGYLLIYSTENHMHKFLQKRIVRIFPTYYTMTLLTFFIALVFPSLFNTTQANFLNLMKSLLFIPYQNSNGLIRPILDVGWALLPEVWFYFLFYLISRVAYKNRYLATIIFILIVCGSVLIWDVDNPFVEQYGILCLYFVVGMILYYLAKKGYVTSLSNRILVSPIFFAVLFVILGLFFSKVYTSPLKSYAYLFPIILFLYTLVIKDHYQGLAFGKLISNISYSMFLSHQFIVKGISRLVYPMEDFSLYTLIGVIISFFCSIVLAYMVNRIIEIKFSNFLWRILNKYNKDW